MNHKIDVDELLDVEAPVEEQPAPQPEPQEAPIVELVDIPVDEATVDIEPKVEASAPEVEEQPAPQPAPKKKKKEQSAPVQEEAPAKEEEPVKQPKPKRSKKAAPAMAGRFLLADGEKVCDSYKIMRGGLVYLTNQRLLFDAYYRADIAIAKVQGVSAVKTTQVRWSKVIFGLLFVAICAACVLLFLHPEYVSFYKDLLDQYDFIQWAVIAVGGVFGLLGLIKLCKCARRHFAVNIITDSMDHAISVRSSTANRQDQFNTVILANPGSKRELNRFLQQFGARLSEIKQSK